MTLLEAVLLGAIQGLFMFIPVSSSSHLVLTQNWLAEAGSPLPSPDTPAAFVLISQPNFDEDAAVDQLPVEEEQTDVEVAPAR